jgi:DNA-binding FrmR family transcriptional regulator
MANNSNHTSSQQPPKPRPSTACHCADTAAQAATQTEKQVIQPHKKALLNRLSRIAGQVNGVAQMISHDRYCVDVLYQISAIRSALDAVSTQLLSDHANGCVRKAVLEDGGEEAIQELLKIIQKLK